MKESINQDKNVGLTSNPARSVENPSIQFR
jgi:hypothetical protein